MDELINSDMLGKVITDLINKLANSIGWIATRETPKRLAVNEYIKGIKETERNPLIRAALISNAKQIIKGYCNQNDIVNIAIQNLQNTAKIDEVEDDWLGRLMDKSKFVSSEEFKYIWGRILARECNKPGSIPINLLYILERMDKEDAKTFTALCRLAVQLQGEYSPVIIDSRFDEYKSLAEIDFDKLISLNALGLIEMNLGPISTQYSLEAKTLPAKITYFDKEYEFSDKKEICIGNVIFTKAGRALCESIDVDKIEGFWEIFCLPFLEKCESIT